MHGKVRIRPPCKFHNRPTPFVVPWYSVARNDQIPRNSVQSVLLAFAPVETPPGRNGDISSRSQRQCRFETNRIARPEKSCTSRILATLKEGVKGSEIRTRSVRVPTRHVEVDLDAGFHRAANPRGFLSKDRRTRIHSVGSLVALCVICFLP